MGKQKTKQRRLNNAASTGHDTDGFPLFDEEAFSSLTDKIKKEFRSTSKSRILTERRAILPKTVREIAQKQKKPGGITKLPDNVKKRDAEGNIKETANDGQKAHKITILTNNNEGESDRSILMQEILALGGDKEDLKLVDSAASLEEDMNGESSQSFPIDTKFVTEVSEFITELGLKDAIDASLYGSESNKDNDEHWDDTNSNVMPTITPSRSVQMFQTSSAHSDGRFKTYQKELKRLMFEARSDWHAALLPVLPDPEPLGPVVHLETIAELKRYAGSLLLVDSEFYASKHLSSTSSHRFLSTIMSSGTLSDKISALTLVVQESPVHTIKSFDGLLALAKKRSRGQAMIALGAIKDLLGIGVILPKDRRLRSFENQPGLLGILQANPNLRWKLGVALPQPIIEGHLISWAYEDWLKNTYFEVLKVLEGWCDDEVEFAKGKAVTYVYELLREKPEQEANLLRLLVNKLGDPDKKIASRTSFLILQLQMTHPLMKPIIIRNIENELLLRPGQSLHAKYYAINTLNQTILSGKEEDVARTLLNTYFNLFAVLFKNPNVQKIAAGPSVNHRGQIQGGGGQIGKMARQKAKKRQISEQNRGEITEKLISAVLTGVNRAFPFAKSDDQTLEKHMDVLFKITHSSNFNTSIQALILIQQFATTKHLAEDRFYRTLYESLLDPRLITSSKHALYLNLLFRALKADLNIRRVKAFSKRLIQVITLHQPPFICGVLYLLKELEMIFPSLKSLLRDAEEWGDVDEVFLDAPDDSVEKAPFVKSAGTTSVHLDSNPSRNVETSIYDGRKRDPEHSNADKCCLWELLSFVTHFHPSVSLFATRLLHGSDTPVKPDLGSHTLIHFLDRFVYRNPKVSRGGFRGSSIMQPLAGGEHQHVLVSNRYAQRNVEPLNSELFWRKRAEDVAVNEVFFHKYFNQMIKGNRVTREERSLNKSNDSNIRIDRSENEDEVWQALLESRPDVEAFSEDGSDSDMLDLDNSEDSSFGSGNTDVEVDDERENPVLMERANMFLNNDEDPPAGMDELFRHKLQFGHLMADSSVNKSSNRIKRKNFKSLPTFAAMEEYEKMLEDDKDE